MVTYTAQDTCLVVIPTFRECENIATVQRALQQLPIACELLVVDDGSDDGTQEVLRGLQLQGQPVTVLQRHRKLGLGTAYTLAMSYAARTEHTYVVLMDADLSHDPADIPRLVEGCREADMAIGSRYVGDGHCEGWPWYRYVVSAGANWLARVILQLRIRDATGGFRCMRRMWLAGMPIERITSTGFAFQCEFNQLATQRRATIVEEPICFRQRIHGDSKMSLGIMIEGLHRLLQLRWRRPHGRRQASSGARV